MEGHSMTVVFGILISSIGAVLLLRAALLRDFRIRLLWPSLVLAWLLVGSSLLFTAGAELVPDDIGIIVFAENYPSLFFIGMLFIAAVGGRLCRPIGHVFAEKVSEG